MIKTESGHFYITFSNGYTVSVFNGFGSYSENHFDRKLLGRESIVSNTCEVAIIYDNNLLRIHEWGDTVKGNVSPEELLEIMNKVSRL